MCENPKGLLFKIFGPLSHACFYIVVVSFMSFYTKMFPKEIRGILENFTGMLSEIGSVLFINIS